MKKVTAFIGTGRKKHTYDAVRIFLDRLEKTGDVETEIIMLPDHRVETCRGCKACFEKGEEFCALKDDRDALLDKIARSDGVVFATPNYSFQVSGYMKILLDRMGFICHRPRYFGKTFTSIVVQGIYGGDKINKYLAFLASSFGFNTVKGTSQTAFEPMTEKERRKWDASLARHAQRFHERLAKPAFPSPSLFSLMAFRMGRTSIRNLLNDSKRDYRYYRDNGWFESGFYYPARLGPFKRAAGLVFDWLAARIWKPAN